MAENTIQFRKIPNLNIRGRTWKMLSPPKVQTGQRTWDLCRASCWKGAIQKCNYMPQRIVNKASWRNLRAHRQCPVADVVLQTNIFNKWKARRVSVIHVRHSSPGNLGIHGVFFRNCNKTYGCAIVLRTSNL